MFYVVYEVVGLEIAQRSGPYSSFEEAEENRRDICRYEGVTDVRVVKQCSL